MRHRRIADARIGLALMVAASAMVGCGGDGQAPELGAIRLTAVTSGQQPDVDPDGYTVAGLPGGAQTLEPHDSRVVAGLASGDYTVTLGGVAANCEVEGTPERTVSVAADDTTEVQWSVACGLIPAALDVVFETPADAAAGSIVFRLDGGDTLRIAAGATIAFDAVPPGGHTVAVTGGTPNCRVDGPASRNITLVRGERATVTLDGACTAGKLAYDQFDFDASPEQGRWSIWLMNADGSGRREITPAGFGSATHPALSPDGTRLAFTSGSSLYVMPLDGGPATPVATVVNIKSPAWSPDGTRLAFSASSPERGDYEVFVVNVDGSGLRNVTNDPARDEDPTWSPDGTQLAFATDRTGAFWVYRIGVDGAGAVPVAEGYLPAWSPTGDRIAFVRDALVHLAGTDGTGLRTLSNISTHTAPAWSPDARVVSIHGTPDNPRVLSYVFLAGGESTALEGIAVAGSYRTSWSR